MPKKIQCLFPGWDKTTDRLYLVGGHDQSVKVGHTCNARARIKLHRAAFGQNFAWAHLFLSVQSGKHEWSVMTRLAEIGQRVRKTEMFLGISKDDAIAAARGVLTGKLDAAEVSARRHLEYRLEQEAWKAFRAQYVELNLAGA